MQIGDREQAAGLRPATSARSEQGPSMTEDWRCVQWSCILSLGAEVAWKQCAVFLETHKQ